MWHWLRALSRVLLQILHIRLMLDETHTNTISTSTPTTVQLSKVIGMAKGNFSQHILVKTQTTIHLSCRLSPKNILKGLYFYTSNYTAGLWFLLMPENWDRATFITFIYCKLCRPFGSFSPIWGQIPKLIPLGGAIWRRNHWAIFDRNKCQFFLRWPCLSQTPLVLEKG